MGAEVVAAEVVDIEVVGIEDVGAEVVEVEVVGREDIGAEDIGAEVVDSEAVGAVVTGVELELRNRIGTTEVQSFSSSTTDGTTELKYLDLICLEEITGAKVEIRTLEDSC